MALTTKQILHLNRGLAQIETNKNNTITYKLNNPMRLQEGDKVTLYKAFLNERGLSPSTMSFIEDTQFTLRFHFWVPYDLRKLGNYNSVDYQEFLQQPADFNAFSSGQSNLEDKFAPYDYEINGPSGHPCILYEVYGDGRDQPRGTVKPVVKTKTVKIPAGNYTTDSIANLIEQQLNGQSGIIPNTQFSSIYDLVTEDKNIFTDDFYDDALVIEFDLYDNTYNPVSGNPNDFFSLDGNGGHILLPLNTHKFVKDRMQGNNYTTIADIEDENIARQSANNPNILPWIYRKFIDNNNSQTGNGNRSEGRPLIGAKNVQFQYSADTENRFSFTGLHTPLQLQTHSTDKIVNPEAASIITQFNLTEIQRVRDLRGIYPVDASCGISVLSFDWDIVTENSGVYKTLTNSAPDEWKLLYWTHSEWFTNLSDNGESLWNTLSVWPRFGFTYNQLGDILSNRKRFNTFGQGQVDMSGFITTNDYNLSQGSSISGLGQGLKTSTGTMFQAFSTVNGFATSQTSGTAKSYSLAILQAQPKFYNADQFPNLLNNRSYYVIHSDIVNTNYLDPTANEGTVVGIASFESATLDTIYSVEGIEFPIVQNKLLTAVNVRISYPDGTDIPNDVLSADSGLVFIIERPAPILEVTNEEAHKDRKHDDK